MKIAVPKSGNEVNAHFGKSEEFAIVSVGSKEIADIEVVSTKSLQHNHKGLAEFLEDEGVEVVIVGGIGQGAYTPLIEKGFKVIRGASGDIREVVNSYLNNKLKDKAVMCNHHHAH